MLNIMLKNKIFAQQIIVTVSAKTIPNATISITRNTDFKY